MPATTETITAVLSKRERAILTACLVDGRTLKDIGRDFCVTGERIRQIKAMAIGKLRKRIELEIDSSIFG